MITKTTYEPDSRDMLRRYTTLEEVETFCREVREATGGEGVYVTFDGGWLAATHTQRSEPKDPYETVR